MTEPVPPRVSHLLEVSLYLDDLDRAQGFYRRLFGAETLLRDGRMAGLAVPGGAVLLPFRRGVSVAPSPTPGGTSRCFRDPDGHSVEIATLGLWATW